MCFTNAATQQGFGMGLQALGTLQQMNAQQQAANTATSQALSNASLARQQSLTVAQQGADQANAARAQGRATISKQNAAYGASGVDANTGSALRTTQATAYSAEQNAQKINYNSMLQQWGLTQEAVSYEDMAKNYQTAAKYNKMSTLLTGLTSLQKSYSQYQSST